jgi:flagellar hook-associated protein 3 FlgL
MTINNVSSSYLAGALLPAVRQAQSQLSTLETESTTGQYADLGLQLGGQSGYELSLRTQDDLLQTLTSANGIVATNMSTAQSALSSILSSAQTSAQSLTQSTATTGSGASLQTLGETNLQQLISVANTSVGNSYVFGGQNTQTAPLDDFYAQPSSTAKTAIDTAFHSYFGFSTSSSQVSNITSSQMQGFLSGPFAAQFESPDWNSNWSTASSANTSSQIAPDDVIETSTNANTSGFQQLAQGYTMLSEFAGIGLGSGAQQALTSAASSLINDGVTSITTTQSQLGLAQSQVTQANSAMSSQMTLLQTEIGRSDSVDAATIATELTTLSTQLETSYQLTAKINGLNLAQYLPT